MIRKLYVTSSPSLLRILHFSSATSSRPDFLSSYLVTKWGFSPDKAAKTADLVPRRVLSPDQPESVVAFLKSHGFDDSHLKKILSMYPQALGHSIETLALRFHTFCGLGFRGNDLHTLVCSDPRVLDRSMEKQVVPMINILKRLLGSHTLLMKCISDARWPIITSNLQRTMQNISVLKKCDLSEQQISMMVSKRPYIITQQLNLLNELISRVERLGMPLGSSNFHWAMHFLSCVGEEKIRAQKEMFKGFGWSEDDFSKAFRRFPGFVTVSTKLLKEKMDFFVKEACCPASYLVPRPVLLGLSLDKRLIPRLQVLKALEEKRLCARNLEFASSMVLTNINFVKRYIDPYKESVPELSQLLCAGS